MVDGVSDASTGFMPSLLDRLLEPDSLGRGMVIHPFPSVIEAVRRDLEHLLNSRRNEDPLLSQYPELAQSVFAYGMPELISHPRSQRPRSPATRAID